MFDLTKTYILALAIIALLVTGAFFVMTHTIDRKAYDATILNISGRQRMLSQRMALLSAQLLYPSKRDWAKTELTKAAAEMKQAHLTLTQGDPERGLPGIQSEIIQAMYFDQNIPYHHGHGHGHSHKTISVDDLVLHYIEEIEEVLQLPDSKLTTSNLSLSHAINDYHDELLPYLHNIVNQYEKESLEHTEQLKRLEIFLLITTLTVLLLEALFIFRPMAQKIKAKTNDLEAANLRLLQNQQQEKLAALGKLSAGMAHEINNSLQPILGLGDLIKNNLEKGNNQKHLGYMNIIMDGALHIRGIVDNVLTFSRQKDLKIETHPAMDLISDALEFSISMTPSTVIFHVTNFWKNGPFPYSMDFDKTSLIQIFMNIIKNASDAMDAKGTINIDITQGTMPKKQKTEALVIKISDTGPGMSKELQKRIFDPFFTTKEVDKGTGLGLSAVHGLIEKHSSAIEVDSILGEGSTFTLYLPIRKKNEEPLQSE